MTYRCLTAAMCALLVTGALAGCGGSAQGGTGAASPRRTVPESATSPPATDPAAEPGPTSTRPRAQDGTNYDACLGGNCEVVVSAPVTITLSDSPIGAGPVTVEKVSTDSVAVRMVLPAGPSLGVTIKTGCTAAFYANNATGLADTSCSGEPGDILGMYVKQTVTVEDIADGTAMLNLTSE